LWIAEADWYHESTMPIYEYVCMSCESHFEELVRNDETPPCPDCGATKAKKQFSVFAAQQSGTQRSGAGAQARFSGPPAGGCCGGACGGH